MELFNSKIDNLLPFDGIVEFYGKVFSEMISTEYYNYLFENIDWKNDEVVIFGKYIITKRKVAWYAEKEFEYSYSNITKKAILFTPELIKLKKNVELITNETYNSCLLNLYHSGEEGMAWHSDGEKDLKKDGAIASLTFGAKRKISFKHKVNKNVLNIDLENGSLLVMKDKTQTNWLHRLPPTKLVSKPRINLTFRTIVR